MGVVERNEMRIWNSSGSSTKAQPLFDEGYQQRGRLLWGE